MNLCNDLCYVSLVSMGILFVHTLLNIEYIRETEKLKIRQVILYNFINPDFTISGQKFKIRKGSYPAYLCLLVKNERPFLIFFANLMKNHTHVLQHKFIMKRVLK